MALATAQLVFFSFSAFAFCSASSSKPRPAWLLARMASIIRWCCEQWRERRGCERGWPPSPLLLPPPRLLPPPHVSQGIEPGGFNHELGLGTENLLRNGAN
jgi:hypothetical protein